MTVVEFLSFPMTERLKNDSSLMFPYFKYLKQAPGFKSMYHGQQTEKDVQYVIIIWESIEHHRAFLKNEELFPPLHDGLLPLAAGKPTIVNAHFQSGQAVIQALSAPATEISYFTAKSGVAEEPIEAVLEDVVDSDMSAVLGCHSFTWGTMVEKPQTYMAILGWDSVEVHTKWATEQTGPQFERAVKLQDVVDVEVAHAKMTPVA